MHRNRHYLTKKAVKSTRAKIASSGNNCTAKLDECPAKWFVSQKKKKNRNQENIKGK